MLHNIIKKNKELALDVNRYFVTLYLKILRWKRRIYFDRMLPAFVPTMTKLIDAVSVNTGIEGVNGNPDLINCPDAKYTAVRTL